MKYTRFVTSIVMSGSLALMSGGSALAADTIDTTGPGSTNIIRILLRRLMPTP